MNALSLCQRVQRRNPSYDISEYLDEVNAAYKETWDYILQLDDSYFTDTKIVTVTTQAAEFDFLYNSNGFLNQAVSFRAYQVDRIRILQPGDTNWVKAAPRNWNDDDFQSLQQITPQPVANSGPYLYQLFAKFSVLFARPLPVGTQIEVAYSFMWMPLQIVFNGTIGTFSAVTDNFNRVQNPINTNWKSVGGFGMVKGQANGTRYIGQNAAATDMLYDGGIAWPDDQFSQATLQTLNLGKGFAGLYVRGTSSINGLSWDAYQFLLDGVFNNQGIGVPTGAKIFKHVGSVGTLLTQNIITPQAGDVFKFQVTGTLLQVFKNGVLILSANDASVLSGKPGIFSSPTNGVAADVAWDDWSSGASIGNAITGVGTNFTQVVPADYLSSLPGNDQDTDIGLEMVLNSGANSQTYRVQSVDSDTALTLITVPPNPIPALTTYNLCTVPDIPEGHHNVISTIATRNFMSTPGNDTRFTSWAALAEKELDSMRDSIMVRQRQEPARVRPFPQRLLRYTAFPNTR